MSYWKYDIRYNTTGKLLQGPHQAKCFYGIYVHSPAQPAHPQSCQSMLSADKFRNVQEFGKWRVKTLVKPTNRNVTLVFTIIICHKGFLVSWYRPISSDDFDSTIQTQTITSDRFRIDAFITRNHYIELVYIFIKKKKTF